MMADRMKDLHLTRFGWEPPQWQSFGPSRQSTRPVAYAPAIIPERAERANEAALASFGAETQETVLKRKRPLRLFEHPERCALL